MAFPAGAIAREHFMDNVAANLRISTTAPKREGRIRLIWSRRVNTQQRRIYLPESLEALRQLLGSFDVLEVSNSKGVVDDSKFRS